MALPACNLQSRSAGKHFTFGKLATARLQALMLDGCTMFCDDFVLLKRTTVSPDPTCDCQRVYKKSQEVAYTFHRLEYCRFSRLP
jgi:hypothetical protein